ncbi:phospholipase D-like domain-containing protein [uncultured Methanoregula sp.]|uniref:phospholipase D-like domain-containing protein n=1 Tax=uncultured Methanoregula sp. TaxID=1005933 RepID=UPI002AAAD0F3|nr:phospholipase D-like domain-containing protein [uncultured Methanoregula sp.]
MRTLVLLAFLIMGLFPLCAAVQIVEFCPDPYLPDDADEYIVLSGHGTLDGITISDNHGGFRFPPGTRIDGTITVARNGPAYIQTHGYNPDFEWVDASPVIPNVISGDPLRLANARDELILYENGVLVQKIVWPGDIKTREGQIHFWKKGVWDPRPLLIGQSRFESKTYPNVTVIAFVLPDSSDNQFSYAVDRASREILLNVYEFSSPAMVDYLVAARIRGVNITVLVEGGPVGGISPSEKAMIAKLNQSGIVTLQMAAPKGGHAPYRYDHAKYMVIDRNAVFLTSENFKFSGFPPTGTSGNRGWGVYLEDPALAAYFSRVYLSDISHGSILPITGIHGPAEPAPATGHVAEFLPQQFDGATVVPVIAPDTSDQITGLLDSARTNIEIEQAYITNETPTTLNPYLATAINASRRGVHVRVLLDSYWYNTADKNDNDEMVMLINRIASHEHLPLEARCADISLNEIEKIHNKGVIVDGRYVLVSSINWNSNSPNFNREAGVIIDHPGIARYFGNVFEDDWNPALTTREKPADYLKYAVVIVIIALLLIVYYRRHRY